MTMYRRFSHCMHISGHLSFGKWSSPLERSKSLNMGDSASYILMAFNVDLK